MCKMIPAAGYLRMSSDKQDKSIDGQRAELLDYAAKHGYEIVKWYSDEGVSGWKNKQRHGFHRLIADAAEGEFRVVLCWDQSRFSRFDPMEANYFWHQLRQAGVTLETIKEGKLDFESLGGWLTASIQQHGKAEYCKSLAHDTVRGRRRRLEAGKWMSAAPYGYKIDPATEKLVPGDPAEVAIVRRVFSERAAGKPLWRIIGGLNGDGIKTKRGAKWCASTVKNILSMVTYIGHSVHGRFSRGKFVRLHSEISTVENTHPPLIDADTWRRAQAVNQVMTLTRKSKARPSTLSPLSGLVHCGHCGHKMYFQSREDRYKCAAYIEHGQCHCISVDAQFALALVANKIRQVILHGSQEALEAAIAKVLAKRSSRVVEDRSATIRKQVADLDRKLSRATERLLEIDADLVDSVKATMRELKDRRDALAAQLQAEPPQEKRPKTAKEIAANLWQLERVLRSGPTETVHAALAQIISGVDFHFTPQQMKYGKAGRNKWHVSGGEVHFLKSTDSLQTSAAL